MPYPQDTRRRSPLWIRESPQRTLHGIALKMMHTQDYQDLTEGQEWLWAAIISELEYRFRNAGPEWTRCSCMLCVPPFPEPMD